MKKPPFPKKIKKKLLAHGDERIDNYYWLRDDTRQSDKILNYLKKENEYSNYYLKKNKKYSDQIFQNYKDALPDKEGKF